MTSGAERWDMVYRQGGAPWDIGRPQPALVRLADSGEIRSPVLDAGCGTGENALFLAQRGFEVVGLDHAPTAIALARAKAVERAVGGIRFLVGDAFALEEAGDRFSTALDWGLYHTFDADSEVPRYLASLRRALEPNGILHLMCFSDREPGIWGPRRVTKAELRANFGDGWRIDSIEPDQFEVVLPAAGPTAEAWLMRVTRLP